MADRKTEVRAVGAGKETSMKLMASLLGAIRKLAGSLLGAARRFGGAAARAMGMHDATTAKRKVVVIGVLSVLLMAAGSAASVAWVHASDQAAARAAAEAARAAANSAVPQLLSYNSATVDSDLDRSRELTTGQFAEDYGKLADQVIRPTAKAEKVTTKASVSATSVATAAPEEVVLLMFLDQQTTSADRKMPRLDLTQIKVTMRDVDGRWLIADLEPL